MALEENPTPRDALEPVTARTASEKKVEDVFYEGEILEPPHLERLEKSWKLTCFCGKRILSPLTSEMPVGRCPKCGRRLRLPGYRPKSGRKKKRSIDALMVRVRAGGVREVVLALNPTLDGDGTALHIQSLLQEADVRVTRPARGLAVGTQLEYATVGMLEAAIRGRSPM